MENWDYIFSYKKYEFPWSIQSSEVLLLISEQHNTYNLKNKKN